MALLTTRPWIQCFLALGVIFLVGGCADSSPEIDPLFSIMARESKEALAVARIGVAGGKLVVADEGEYAGTGLEIPAGALSKDEVFAIHAAADITDAAGYVFLGPTARYFGTAKSLRAAATITLPYNSDAVTEGVNNDGVGLLMLADDKYALVGGSGKMAGSVSALVSTLGTAVVVGEWSPERVIDEPVSLRCEPLIGAMSLSRAISSSSLLAQLTYDDKAKLLSARSIGPSNGCGVSLGWELIWYTASPEEREATYEAWPSGVTLTNVATTLTCTPVPYEGTASSVALSDDFAERWGSTPGDMKYEILNCNTTPTFLAPRIRLSIPGTSKYVDYAPGGDLLLSGL